mgnify:CR=1 FL=1|tara:strand:+ start:1876 stop:2364 length:489 start_codon:yes stop_codon:yes gene_type:complete
MRFLEEVFYWLFYCLAVVLLIIFFIILVPTSIVWVPVFVGLVLRWGTKLSFFMQTKFGCWLTFEDLEQSSGVRGKCLEWALSSIGGTGKKSSVIRRIRPEMLDEVLENLGEERVRELEEEEFWFSSLKDNTEIWEFSLIRKSGGRRKFLPKTVFTKWKPQHA